MKKTIPLILALFMIFTFTGCVGEQTFVKNGFFIVLPQNFNEEDNGAYTFYITDKKSIVAVTSDRFTNLAAIGITEESSEKDYAEAVALKGNYTSHITEEKNGAKFEYDAVGSDGITYHYYNFAKKGTEGFWLCSFACEKKDAEKYEPLFSQWSEKIRTK